MNTPELYVAIADEEKFAFMERLLQKAQFGGGQTNTIDGLRVDFEDGWGLVRPSNTTPNLVLRFEANDELALFRIQGVFREQLLAVEPTLQLPF
jgi:phosphomannomutase/phosphoglucomutase